MKKLFWIQLVSVLILFIAVASIAQVKSYTIHQSSHVDEVTAAAVDSKTGDIVVAWTENITSAKVQAIWACYLKRNPNGSYTAQKPVMLTKTGVFAHNPTVAYSPVYKRFLVIFGVGQQPAKIYAVIIKRGKVKKTRELWTEEGGTSSDTMAAYGLTSKNSIPGKKTAFVIAKHTFASDVRAAPQRLYLFLVSKKGKSTGTPMLMQTQGESEDSFIGGRVGDMKIGSDGTIYIALRWYSFPPAGGTNYYTGAIVGNSDGTFAGAVTLDTQTQQYSIGTKLAMSSSKTAVVAWRRGNDASVRYRTITSKAKTKGGESSAFNVDFLWDDFAVASDANNKVYFFENVSAGDELFLKLGSNGKISDNAKIKIPQIRTTFYTMAGNEKNNEVVLITNTTLNNGKTAIVVTVIRPGALF